MRYQAMPVPTPAESGRTPKRKTHITRQPVARFCGPSAPADAPRVPTAPAHAGEALKVRRDRPLGSPLMGSDAALGFRDLSLQGGYGFLCLAGGPGHLAHRKPNCFQGLHCVTVLLELNPVPSDVAIAVRNHVAAPATDLETRYFFEWLMMGGLG
jgi:hypothetical protein